MAVDIRGMAPLLQVFDMPTSLKFYRDALGFEVLTTSTPRGEHFDWALLRLNGVELMLIPLTKKTRGRPLLTWPGSRRTRIHACTSVARTWMRRMPTCEPAASPPKEPKVAPYGMKQLSLSDPDGYSICFQWPAK